MWKNIWVSGYPRKPNSGFWAEWIPHTVFVRHREGRSLHLGSGEAQCWVQPLFRGVQNNGPTFLQSLSRYLALKFLSFFFPLLSISVIFFGSIFYISLFFFLFRSYAVPSPASFFDFVSENHEQCLGFCSFLAFLFRGRCGGWGQERWNPLRKLACDGFFMRVGVLCFFLLRLCEHRLHNFFRFCMCFVRMCVHACG